MHTRFIVIFLAILAFGFLTAQDATALTAAAGPDTVLNITPSVTAVHLDGSNSSDDGSIVKYEWWNGDTYIGQGQSRWYNPGSGNATYTIKLVVTDNDGNTASDTMILTVNNTTVPADTEAPVITLLGDNTINLTIGDNYTDSGATANDNIDGDITASIVVNNSVNTSTAGSYTVSYNISDTAGNAADEVTRTVTVTVPGSTTGFYSDNLPLYQNPASSMAAQSGDDLTNWGADETQMDMDKMNSLIITAYPTEVTGADFGSVTSLPTSANSGDVAQFNGNRYIYSGLESKWVIGRDLNDKNTTNSYIYMAPMRAMFGEIAANHGGTIYLPKGVYANQINGYSPDNSNHPILENFRLIGDGADKTIIDNSYFKDQLYWQEVAIILPSSNNVGGFNGLKNVILSDFKIISYGVAIDIFSASNVIGDNLLIKNIDIVKPTHRYDAVIQLNKSYLMQLSRVTLDNINSSYEGDGITFHELALFKGKYFKIRNCSFDANPQEFNIDMHTMFTEVSNCYLSKRIHDTWRPNVKFPNANYVLFNKVHFKNIGSSAGNVLISSSPDHYKMEFINCTFEANGQAIFQTYSHIGYGVDELVLLNNTIIGAPTEFQIYGADKVYIQGNKKEEVDFNEIKFFTYDNYQQPSVYFAPLQVIKEIIRTGTPEASGIGYKTWDNHRNDHVARRMSAIYPSLNFNLTNVTSVSNAVEFEQALTALSGTANGGCIRVEGNIVLDNSIILDKVGIIGSGTLEVPSITVNNESYIGNGLQLQVNSNIIVSGTLIVRTAAVSTLSATGQLFTGTDNSSWLIVESSSLEGGEQIIGGSFYYVMLDGENVISNYSDCGIKVTSTFLNITDTKFIGGNVGIYVNDVVNLYCDRIDAVDTSNGALYLAYHANTKVIDVTDINTNNDIQISTSSSYDQCNLVDIAVGRLKKDGNYQDVTLITPTADCAYMFNGVTLQPAGGLSYRWQQVGTGGAIYSAHIPMGFFPAEWNEINSTPFPRP